MGGHQLARAALEQRAPLARDRLGVLEVLLEERAGEACVQAVDFVHAHRLCCTSRDPSRAARSAAQYSGWFGEHGRRHADRRSRRRRSRSRTPRGAGAGRPSQPRSGRAAAQPGSAGRGGTRRRPGWRRSTGTRAGPRSRRRDVREIRGGRSPSSHRPAGPASASRAGPGLGLRERGRHGGLGSRSSASHGQPRRLGRLRLGPHCPVDHQAEIDDRDLQDHHHEDELPDHRRSIRDGLPGRARSGQAGRPSLSAAGRVSASCPSRPSHSRAPRAGTRRARSRRPRSGLRPSYAPDQLAPLPPSPCTQMSTTGYLWGQYHVMHAWKFPCVHASVE